MRTWNRVPCIRIPKCFSNILDTVLYITYVNSKTIRLLDYIVYTQKLYISYQCIYFLYINKQEYVSCCATQSFSFLYARHRDWTREYWIIREGQPDAFSPLYDLAPPPPPSPNPLFRQQIVSLAQSSCVSPVELTDGRGQGQGGGWSQIIK